ncbi:hypothetical protein ACFE04_011113 [Oxalis oulophora]
MTLSDLSLGRGILLLASPEVSTGSYMTPPGLLRSVKSPGGYSVNTLVASRRKLPHLENNLKRPDGVTYDTVGTSRAGNSKIPQQIGKSHTYMTPTGLLRTVTLFFQLCRV